MKTVIARQLTACLATIGFAIGIAQAAEPAVDDSLWRLCPAPPAATVLTPYDGPPRILADELDSHGDGITELRGQVSLQDAGRQLDAQRMRIDRPRGLVDAEGQVRYATGQFELSGEQARVELNSEYATLQPATYRVPELHAQGRADTATRDSQQRVILEHASFSTCPPEAEHWAIHAGRLELDTQEEIGTAYNIHLDLFGIPVFWSPWISFPIGERRKSGFLFPSFGNSGRNGFEIELPWYWNIAPDIDATITARSLSRRGLMLQNEVRYLNRQGDWQLDAEILDNDRQTDEQRSFWRIQHQGRLGQRWRTRVDAAGASDEDYFTDFGTNLDSTTTTHLRRAADLDYADGTYSAQARLEAFQTLDESIGPAGRPYRRLPQLRFNAKPAARDDGLQFQFESELVNFSRDQSDEGLRLDMTPRVSWSTGSPAWYVKPSLAWRLTAYDIESAAGAAESNDREVPIASIDSGLFFDRQLGPDGRYLQTLEPRLYYLYVPFRQQQGLARFDTAELDFGFSQLFRENRFSGADRIGDANQLTLALSTRLLENDEGRELMSASIGQIQYLSDRRVGLNASSPVDDRSHSDLVLEGSVSASRFWQISTQLQYDPDSDLNSRGSLRVQYQADNDHIANLGYRYRRGEQEQIDVSTRWALGDRWRLLARWNYSLLDDSVIETIGGFEYESCCWILRVLAREYLADDDETIDRVETDSSIYAQFVLKGMGGIGRNLGSRLEDDILGYREQTD